MGRIGGALGWTVVGVALTLLALVRCASATEVAVTAGVMNAWLARRAFTGVGGALAVRSHQFPLSVGDSILVFQADRPAERRCITRMVNPDSALAVPARMGFDELVADTSLWNLYGDARQLTSRSNPPASIAWFAPPRGADPDIRSGSLPFALADWPAGTIAVGADAHSLDANVVARLLSRLAGAVPPDFLRAGSLRRGRAYRESSNDEIVELCLGVPVRQPPRHGATLRSVRMLRLYLVNGHLLGSEILARKTGEAEHIDLEPPQLNERNWWDVPEQPIGFVSQDGGASWDRISIDVGFEGILWRVSRLAPGLPEQWSDYLYTYH